jgi:DNA repair exonuclease SbcCD ATPase subunit
VKRLLINLLNALGLVTAGRYGAVAEKLRDAESRIDKLTTLLGEARAEARQWSTSADNTAQRVKAIEKDLAQRGAQHDRDMERRTQEAEKQTRENEKLRGENERLRKTLGDLEALRRRLADAERGIVVAREHLMAVDVKLDILEGAANVLDSRTRAVVAQQSGERNAPA